MRELLPSKSATTRHAPQAGVNNGIMLTTLLRSVSFQQSPLSSLHRRALTTSLSALRGGSHHLATLQTSGTGAISSPTSCRTPSLFSRRQARCLPQTDGIATSGGSAYELLEDTVPPAGQRSRLDAFVSTRWPAVSRARWQEAIKEGLVAVNGKTQKKVRPPDMEGMSLENLTGESYAA